MDRLFEFIKENLNYSDYEIALLRYQLTAFLYDISKLILMALFFCCTGYGLEYFTAVIVLLLLRTTTGGLHFKSYMGCLIFTFSFFLMGVVILPQIKLTKLTILIALFSCAIIVYILGPIVSKNRREPDKNLVKRCKLNSTNIIFFYGLLTYIIPLNSYIVSGFWVIILQVIQLVIAYILKKRRCRNETESH